MKSSETTVKVGLYKLNLLRMLDKLDVIDSLSYGYVYDENGEVWTSFLIRWSNGK